MKKLFALLLALVMVLSLAACGGGRTKAAAPAEKPAEAAGEEAAAPVAEAGIEAGATIGVSLPWLGTQNWKEAEEMFKTELEAAGFKPLIQAADNKVPQQQIEAMIENGAKGIVVGPIDGTQLGSVLEQAIEIIKSLQAGNGMPATDVTTNNGKIDVPVYELPPVVVIKDNAKEVFANDPGRMALLVD